MKRKYILAAAILTMALSGGCQKADDNQIQKEAENNTVVSEEQTGTEQAHEELSDKELSNKETPDTQQTETHANEIQTKNDKVTKVGFDFEDLSDHVFYFSSGAGAWGTELFIHGDGTFAGNYHDSDMGDFEEAYPNGTLYYCDFTGKFTDLEKVNAYTYRMRLDSLTFKEEPERQKIMDGTLYIYSTAYGLDGGEEFYLYLPGAKLADLPEGYLNWIRYVTIDADTDAVLPFYGLYNINAENGFSSAEYKIQTLADRIAAEISYAEQRDAELHDRLQNASSQYDMNEASAELYQVWDDTLNVVWTLLEAELDSTVMDTLRAEEREWIISKEAAVKDAGLDYEGGSMQPMAEAMKGAELTKKRVYELAKYADTEF